MRNTWITFLIAQLVVLFGVVEGARFYSYTALGSARIATESSSGSCARWSNLQNAVDSDVNSFSSVLVGRGGHGGPNKRNLIEEAKRNHFVNSCSLTLSNINWTTPFPSANTSFVIKGIQVVLRLSSTDSDTSLETLRLRRNNDDVGDNKRGRVGSRVSVDYFPVTSNDLWGVSNWQLSDFMDSGFGMRLVFRRDSNDLRLVRLYAAGAAVYIDVHAYPTRVFPESQSGIQAGGNVTIYGVNFLPVGTNPRARFGNAPSTCTWISATEISCPAPAQSGVGPQIVTISMDGRTWSDEDNVTYSYLDDSTCNPPCVHGFCNQTTLTCNCNGTGYHGNSCEIPYGCDPPCVKGFCTPELTCNCTGTGYIGTACEEELNCTPPCENAGVCAPGLVCDCSRTGGYMGDRCELICLPTCVNGICTENGCNCEGTGFTGPRCNIELEEINSSPVDDGDDSVIVALGLILGVVLLLVIVGVFIGFFLYKKHGKKFASGKKLKKPNFANMLFANCKPPSVTPELSEKLHSLQELLLQPEGDLAMALVVATPINTAEQSAKAIVHIFEHHKKFTGLLERALRREVQNCASENVILRATNFSSYLFKFYSQLVGMDYLFDTLSALVNDLLLEEPDDSDYVRHSSKHISVELDPTKMTEEDDESINKLQLQLICQKIFVAILKSSDAVPMQLRYFFSVVQEEMQKKFNSDDDKAIGSLMFLRFICPALVAPQQFGIAKEPPKSSLQRRLVLVTKVLQNLVNNVEFGTKEHYMTVLNPFLQENREKMRAFLKKISTVPADWEEQISKPIAVPTTVKDSALYALYSTLYNFDKKVIVDYLNEQHKDDIAKQLEDILSVDPDD